MRYDIEPFNDIRVRTAMQMAIDIESIATNYYKGYATGEYTGLLITLFGEDWSVP
jgi:ABC-type oligopeptide transport system substrate-binding subunit